MEVIKEDGKGLEERISMIVSAAGVVVIDDFRTTTPRTMQTAEGYDVRQTQGINLSAPHSTSGVWERHVNRTDDPETASESLAIPMSPGDTQAVIRPFQHLSHTFARQAADFRVQIKQRIRENRIDVEDEGARGQEVSVLSMLASSTNDFKTM
jgi:hypothetical protein